MHVDKAKRSETVALHEYRMSDNSVRYRIRRIYL